jgi:hypothetical protein
VAAPNGTFQFTHVNPYSRKPVIRPVHFSASKRFRERIKINGTEISEDFVCTLSIQTNFRGKRHEFFRIAWFGFDYFAKEKVDT